MMDCTMITERSFLACLMAAAVVGYQILKTVYRVHFHPLSKFPGPRAAAISRRWQSKLVDAGYPEVEYEKLHKDLNTRALRIGPNQLHISDPSLYKVIYSQVNPFPKEDSFYDTFGTPHTLFAETDAQLHKERRKMLNPLFSKSGMTKLEPLMIEKLEEVKSKIRSISKAGPIAVGNAFRCMTVDIITEFAFGSCANITNEHPTSFDSEFLQAFDIATQVPYKRYYSAMQRLAAKWVPLSVAGNFDPALRQMAGLVQMAASSHDDYTRRTTSSSLPVVFDNLQSLPDDLQKTESIDILVAGSETSAFTLSAALYHILGIPEVERALVSSLDEAFGASQTVPPLAQLEQIQYLRACVKEAVRIAMPVPGVLPRIVPKQAQPFVVDGKVVPAGTLVGMSAHTMHYDTQIWGPDAKSFNPERWLGPDAKQLETHLVTFSKGARQCIGINVAYAEITITLAHLFYQFKMELKTKQMVTVDKFTQMVQGPGVLVDFRPRQRS